MNDIISNLNVTLEKIYASVDSKIYELIDKIFIIRSDILEISPLKDFFDKKFYNNYVLICLTLLFMYVIYFVTIKIINLYNGKESENIYLFLFKIIVIGIIIQNFKFIFEIFFEFSDSILFCIDKLFTSVIKSDISFVNLKDEIISVNQVLGQDMLSLSGILKTTVSFGCISILINFSIRYVTIILAIMLFPISLIFLSRKNTSWIFLSLIKVFIINIIQQFIGYFIICIPLMCKNLDEELYQVIMIGSVYMLYKINGITSQFFQK